MNHATHSANVDKFVAHRAGGWISFFSARDIAVGEELRYSYSPGYWKVKGTTLV